MKIITLGIDLAKNVFAVHGVDEFGKVALVRPSVRRDQLLELIATIPPCVIGMEACSGAAAPRKTGRLSRWARSVKERRGHGKAQVAVAAKNARMAWAVLAKGEARRLRRSNSDEVVVLILRQA